MAALAQVDSSDRNPVEQLEEDPTHGTAVVGSALATGKALSDLDVPYTP